MKAHLTKLSLALLSTVFLLGCQEQGSGPVGPEGLGPEFDHKPKHNPGGGGGGDPQLFKVTVTSTEGHISSATHDAKLGSGGHVLAEGFTLDLKDFFEFKLTCGATTTPILGEQTGNFVLVEPSSGSDGDGFVSFYFTHNAIRHQLVMRGTITDQDNWPPATGTSNSMTERLALNGHWLVQASGKDHRNGCTGEGGSLVDGNGIVFTATVVGL